MGFHMVVLLLYDQNNIQAKGKQPDHQPHFTLINPHFAQMNKAVFKRNNNKTSALPQNTLNTSTVPDRVIFRR